MKTTIYMGNGQTIEEYVNQLVDERIVSLLTEHLSLNIRTNWYNPTEKEIKLYYKDELITWDFLHIPTQEN